MIRQLCPHCQKLVELPDSAAGAVADCPQCAKPIAVPSAYAPGVAAGGGLTVPPPPPIPVPTPTPVPPPPTPVPDTTSPQISDQPPPPPGLKPEVLNPPPPPSPPDAPPTVPIPSGYGSILSLTLQPGWLAWVPVACVTLALVLTLFSWAGTFPGGIRIYSQNPWWALFGEMSTDPGPESLLKEEGEIAKLLTGSRWMIAYLPLLLLGVGLLWVERAVKHPTIQTMPGPLAWVVRVWPKRFGMLVLLTGLLYLFIVLQAWRGFGLEHALRERVAAANADVLKAAESTSTVEKWKAAATVGAEYAKFQYQTTTPFALAVWAHLLAFLASLARWWLSRRGAKPYPRLLLQW